MTDELSLFYFYISGPVYFAPSITSRVYLVSYITAVQSQKPLSAYFTSMQILPFHSIQGVMNTMTGYIREIHVKADQVYTEKEVARWPKWS